MKLIVDIEGRRQEYPVHEGLSTLGRDMDCHITIPSTALSRRHLEIRYRGGELSVRDLGSRNGTFVNDRLVKEEALVRPGDTVRAGTLAIRFDFGAAAEETAPPPSAARPGAPSQAPLMPIITSPAPPPPPDTQSTPPSLTAAAPAAPAVLAPQAPAGAARKLLTPRVRIALIAIGAATLLAIVGMAVHKARRPSGPQNLVISLQTFQDCVNKAVKLAETGAEDKAIAGLKDLARFKTIPERATGRFLLEALENSAKLKTDFAASWEKALDAWERLDHDNATTFQARELARARRDAILRESKSMTLRDRALEAFQKGDFVEFFKQTAKISSDSPFLASLADQIRDAKERLAAQQTAKADQNDKARNWSAAIQDLQAILQYVPEMQTALEPRIAKLRGLNLQQDRIAQAAKSLDAGKVAEARATLDGIPADSPYAAEKTAALARAIKIEAERAATTAFDAGDSAKAVQILKQAGLGEGELARKAAMVAEQHKIMTDSITQLLFKQADTAAERITTLEPKEDNWYHAKASDYLKNKGAVRTRQAEQFAAQATQAYRDQKYNEARELYEKARGLDPRLASASQGISVLKSEAARVFNVEVLAKRDTDPQAALKAAKEVRDRLRPGETFHTQALQVIKELEDKLGKQE